MKRNRWIQFGIILFIGLNLLLVFIDEDGKVDRVSYVNEWSESFTTDMKEELDKHVVLDTMAEESIYFDESQGIFQEFIVNEGDEVAVGDDLFTYQVHNYFETEASLLNQIEKVNGEIAAIEQAITQIEQYGIPEQGSDVASSILITEEDIFVELPESSIDAKLIKEQFLIEKEKELAQKRAETDILGKQLGELQTTGDTLTYQSPYAGEIRQLSAELMNPIIVVAGLDLEIIGDLTEAERHQVEQGMEAELELIETDILLQSTIETLSITPTEVDVDKESVYPFTAIIAEEEEVEAESNPEIEPELESEAESDPEIEPELESESDSETEPEPELLPGYHGMLSITLKEIIGATAINEAALVNQAVWKMDATGSLVRQPVETGMHQEKQFEIISGVDSGELVAEGPKKHLRDGSDFITPIQWKKLTGNVANWKEIDWKKPFVSGLISR